MTLLHREFSRTITACDATEHERADLIDAGCEAAILAWRLAANAASNALYDCRQRKFRAQQAVIAARRALEEAELALVKVSADVDGATPRLQEASTLAIRDYECARQAVLHARRFGRDWRISRNGRVVSADGETDVGRADHSARVRIRAWAGPADK